VGTQLTFISSLSPRPRTWMWLRRWSVWCWKSSTLACATLYTTIPTWCTRCSTRESSLSSSGRTHPSRTSCRTSTRSVAYQKWIKRTLDLEALYPDGFGWFAEIFYIDQGFIDFYSVSSLCAGKGSESWTVLERMRTASLTWSLWQARPFETK